MPRTATNRSTRIPPSLTTDPAAARAARLARERAEAVHELRSLVWQFREAYREERRAYRECDRGDRLYKFGEHCAPGGTGPHVCVARTLESALRARGVIPERDIELPRLRALGLTTVEQRRELRAAIRVARGSAEALRRELASACGTKADWELARIRREVPLTWEVSGDLLMLWLLSCSDLRAAAKTVERIAEEVEEAMGAPTATKASAPRRAQAAPEDVMRWARAVALLRPILQAIDGGDAWDYARIRRAAKQGFNGPLRSLAPHVRPGGVLCREVLALKERLESHEQRAKMDADSAEVEGRTVANLPP